MHAGGDGRYRNADHLSIFQHCFPRIDGGCAALRDHEAVETAATGAQSDMKASPGLFVTDATNFLAHSELHEEVFGAASLIVRCPDIVAVRQVLERLEGQLTAAMHIDEADHDLVRDLLPLLERRVGRILINGFGIGVEVSHAMVHGGPFPSTADGRSTSVGSLTIARFLRPICYQDFPAGLLSTELQGEAEGLSFAL
ncbi:hypothetical protein [Paracoccus sp. (in: a-proteobacteria)]|uniref:hypothetical protein n=1 Tax=Paracoccus sp. TaxID=267 RepID=UPI0026E0FF79|nr:hypothetical protein [Paracoccus sp. (in: a-proteobacteria)]